MRTALIYVAPAALFALALIASAQSVTPPAREIALYPGVAPGSENWSWSERELVSPSGMPMVQNVVRPVLQYYPADKATTVGTAMIVAPGGGFRTLMMSYEGVDIAQRLNKMGVDAFVLKYRLIYVDPDAPPPPRNESGRSSTGPRVGPPASEIAAGNPKSAQAGQNLRDIGGEDGQQAVRLVRGRAAEFGVRPDRIGLMGFSAGAAVTLAAVTGPADSRPDFAAPIYAPWGGEASPPADGAPPLFIAVASDDQAVGDQGSVDLYMAWRKANVPVELHAFQTGAHGFVKKGGGADHFMDRLEEWLQVNGWLTKAAE